MILLMSVAGLALSLSPAMARPGGRGGGNQATKPALSVAEAQSLTFMREEEKLARDVYLYLFDLWGTRVFSNIADAEQTHMDALKKMLDKYGLPDPILEEGVFSNSDLQKLYDELIVSGSTSLINALKVGCLAA